MAATGSSRIAWQRENLAVFAEATVSIERGKTADGAAGSILGLDKVPEPWRAGALFGFLLLRESLTGKVDLQHASIAVTSFHGQPCDTTLMAAAFVAFHAAAKALGVDVSEIFRFDDSSGNFTFSIPEIFH